MFGSAGKFLFNLNKKSDTPQLYLFKSYLTF